MTMASTVRSYLEGRGVPYELITHPVTGSSHENAEAAHVDEEHIAKAVVLEDEQGAVMAVVPGGRWVRLHGINNELGRELHLAGEADASARVPDCERGAIPPLGPAYGVDTLLDEDLTHLAYVYFEAGDHQHLVKVDGGDFLSLLPGARRGHFTEAH